MWVTVFRSRLRPEAEPKYAAWAARMSALARAMPGHLSHKTFVAEDGERVTIAEFETVEAQRAWRDLPEHVEAQELGRAELYEVYRIEVCRLVEAREFRSSGSSPGPRHR